MRVVINQPNYIPWRGYFDLIDDADMFVFYDDVQYTTRDWRNRNQIKTRAGLAWLTVAVAKATRSTLIKDIKISYQQPWNGPLWSAAHRHLLTEAYGTAPYFKNYAEGFFDILEKKHERLVVLDIETTKYIMQILNIFTPTRLASEFDVSGHKTERLIQIVKACGGNEYLSGPAAKTYIDPEMFLSRGMGLSWKSYDYAPYPQQWGAFEPQTSVLDLLFNCGPDARNFLKSRPPDKQIYLKEV